MTMIDLRLLKVMCREWIGPRTLPRQPEPDLVMGGEDEVASYALAGREDPDFSAVNLLHAAHISQRVHGSRHVVDLACGPATLLIELARLNPGVLFHGIDLSDRMIGVANERITASGLGNIHISKGDITALDQLADRSADALISTVALHHLPTLDHLRRCFREIARILRPGGALYISDFSRFKAESSVMHFAYLNDNGRTPALASYYKDYERSLRAAFLLEDFSRLCEKELSGAAARIATTAPVPFLFMIHTDAPAGARLAPAAAEKMRRDYLALPPLARARLDQLRFLLRLGGLSDAPFKRLLAGRGI